MGDLWTISEGIAEIFRLFATLWKNCRIILNNYLYFYFFLYLCMWKNNKDENIPKTIILNN